MAEPSNELRNHFRLIAIEFLLSETLAVRYLATSDPVAAAAVHREHMREIWSQAAAPFLRDAGDSELAVGEIGDAIDELIDQAAQAVTRIMGERRKP